MMQRGRNAEALLLLIGTIVGAGMFGIPFVFERAGFLTGAALLVMLTAAATLVHLAYAEVVSRTSEVHRLPGYVRLYLGRGAGWLATASYTFGLSGALLAYLVLGGSFLGALIGWASPAAPAYAGPLAFYFFGVLVIARGIRFEGLADAILTLGLVAAILLLGVTLLPAIQPASLTEFHPGRLPIPYGVLLFSLAGAAIIPDLKRVLGPDGLPLLGKVVASGTLISAGLYLIFAVAVVGATGAATTPDAISGLAASFDTPYLIFGNVIGVLATITSFIALGVVFEGMLVSDFRFGPRPAWLVTAAIPAALYLLGFRDFIAIISLIGALAIGLDSLLILFTHARAAKLAHRGALHISMPGIVRILLMFIFAAGVLYEFFSFAIAR